MVKKEYICEKGKKSILVITDLTTEIQPGATLILGFAGIGLIGSKQQVGTHIAIALGDRGSRRQAGDEPVVIRVGSLAEAHNRTQHRQSQRLRSVIGCADGFVQIFVQQDTTGDQGQTE